MMDQGTTDNDLLLAACRNDQDEMLQDILKEQDYDINYADPLGDTALHYAARFGSLTCLELLLEQPGIQVNARNKKEGNTPLHLAVQYEDDPEVAVAMVSALLDKGADPRLKNKANSSAADYVVGRQDDMRDLIDQSMAGYDMSDSDEEDMQVIFK
ncbi:ankyrin repeat-containing domain protein [Gilbertella persicaria]|uniref:ankyrin repeat-containing domain protein n=1 Tax=Gilbertella persicaria TaxID=101096 RepID=UPI002220E100|nr:ankyrin repeat-containing domain protein [Gilbertella persicaria]KAI8051074.1 ankyrin repeat-containing domain protein [Gilbertella persicaria]